MIVNRRQQTTWNCKPGSGLLKNMLESALAHHRAGRLAEAEAIYRQILATDPQQADSLHLLGMIRHQQGDHNSPWK